MVPEARLSRLPNRAYTVYRAINMKNENTQNIGANSFLYLQMCFCLQSVIQKPFRFYP